MRARSGLRRTSPSIGGFAVGREGVDGVGGLFDAGAGLGEVGEAELDVVADDLRGGGAGFAVVDGGFEELSPFEFAVALVEVPPGVERAGDGDGDGSVRGKGSVLCAGAGDFESEGFGGATGAGEGDDLVEFGVPDHGVAVAADAAGGGFDEAEDGVGGDGGVDGGAAFFEDLDGGEGGEGMRGSGGSAAAHGGGAGGEAGSGDAVAGVDVGAVEFLSACGLEFGEISWRGSVCLAEDVRRADRGHGAGGGEGKGCNEGATAHGVLLGVERDSIYQAGLALVSESTIGARHPIEF